MKKTSLLIILFTFFVINAFSQNSDTNRPIFYIGGYVGYLYNLHNASFNKLEGFANCCPQFTDGSGSGAAVGLLFEYPLDDWWRITARFGMAGLSGELSRNEKIGNTEVKPANGFETGEITDAVSEYRITSHVQLIGIEPGVTYYPIPKLNLNAGLRLGFLSNTTFDQSEKLISPNNVVFAESGTKARNEASGQEIPQTNSLQIHPFLGVAYDFPIFKSASFTPEVRYYMALNNLSNIDNTGDGDKYWKVNSFQLGAAVKFPLFKPTEKTYLKELKIIRDTTVNEIVGINQTEIKLVKTESVVSKENPNADTEIETTTLYESYVMNIPRAAKLTAELKVTGLNRDGSRQINPSIIIEEIETEEGFPLLPYIFFKETDKNLQNTSMKLIAKSEVDKFDPNKMNWETLDIYSNLLNIVGYRMKNSKASITLTGTNNNLDKEKAVANLSKNRAEAVRDYLVNTWDISPSRINIQSRNLPLKPANNDIPEGREENQRVEITSADINITAPLTLKDIVRTANPPKIEIIPKLYSEVGMDKWNIKISQRGILLREYSGSGNGDSNIWDIEDHPIPSLEEPVKIALNYSDKTGKTGEIIKDVKVSQLTIKKKRFELKDDKRIERFSLILFDYDKADLTDAQKRILGDVKTKIKPESKVIISGYADRTGELQYNKELAARRNAEVQKILKVSDSALITQNIGSSELLYSNNTPEGRSYCRTVKVLVETPVE